MLLLSHQQVKRKNKKKDYICSMTIELKYKDIAKWFGILLLISTIVNIYLISMLGENVNTERTITEYRKELSYKDSVIGDLENSRSKYFFQVDSLKKKAEAINLRFNELKSEYGAKTRVSKNNQAKERFSGKKDILNTDSNVLCFDSSGIDSINRVAMAYDYLSDLLPVKDAIIANQDSVILADSLIKKELTDKFEIADKFGVEKSKQANKYKKQRDSLVKIGIGVLSICTLGLIVL